jgi:class 3 adenylate cyclase
MMDTEEVGDMLNELWQPIDAAIVECGGMIDKHIGDAVMALWGVPRWAGNRRPECDIGRKFTVAAIPKARSGIPPLPLAQVRLAHPLIPQ